MLKVFSNLNDIKNALLRSSPVPSEKILMYLMGLLFLIAGIYGFHQYRIGSDDVNSVEGPLILLISLRIMSGDTPFGTFRCSVRLSILGSVGIVISVFDMLLPYAFTELIQVITMVILAIYSAMCLIWAIKGRENNGPILRSLCMVFGLLLIFMIFDMANIFEFKNCLPYSIMMIAMGLTMTGMAYTRKNFPTHDENEFPILSLTLFFTGVVTLCNVVAIIVTMVTDGNIKLSLMGMMAVFLMILSLRLISEGDSPFGKIGRSNLVVIAGIICMMISMIAVIVPSDTLHSAMSYVLGILNLVEGIRLLRMLLMKKKEIQKVKIRMVITSVTAILFAINLLIPGVIDRTMLLLTMVLMSLTMISLGITIFTLRWSKIKRPDTTVL